MSHFAVCVLTPSIEGVDTQLAPYQENNMGDCPRKYMTFHDVEPESRRDYEDSNNTVEKVRAPDGALLSKYDDRFKALRDPELGSIEFVVPENSGYEMVQVPVKDLFPTFDAYMADDGYKKDQETGKYGYWENPNAKWDWYQIGGRASGMLPLKAGGSTSVAQIKDIEFGAIEARVKAAERFWEIAVEGAELLPGEEKPFIHWTPEGYIKQFGSKDNYVRCNSRVYPWAFISPDGEWHERGEMGWFACSDATGESTTDFMDLWDKTIAEADPELYVVVVDCHI